MAVIKIPSKHIYSIDNQKVIDNKVDKIEVKVKEPQIVSATENVYNETVTSGFYDDGVSEGINVDTYSGGDVYTPDYWVSYVRVYPKYVTTTFSVPKSKKNTYILRVLTGTDNYGSSNIKYSLRGNVKKGDLTATGTFTINVKTPSGDTSYSATVDSNSIKKTETFNESDTSYSLNDKNLLKADYEYKYFAEGNRHLIATATLPTKTDVFSAKIDREDSEYYYLTFSILSGLITQRFWGHENLFGVNKPHSFSFSGNYEEYIPTQVDVSFYGDTIKLDLQNETLTISKNGKYPMLFSGNELMQTTNTPTVEETYKNIITHWKDGKECATIRCGIEDYYIIEKKIIVSVLSQNLTDKGTEIDILTNEYITVGTILDFGNDVEFNVIEHVSKNIYKCFIGRFIGLATGELTATIKGKIISKSGENNLAMTFHIGDIVVPYVYGANGQDKPMSVYKDNTEKEFQVVGKKIIYDGAIWQELTLQEYKQNHSDTPDKKNIVKVKIGDILSEYNQIAYLELFVVEGTINVGTILEYQGEKATVTEFSGDYYSLECDYGGKFYVSRNQTITVTKK